MIITGIGSRSTPPDILEQMTLIGEWCRTNKHTLRSGHAEGADWAFEQGAQEWCITYVPSEDFNKHLSSLALKFVVGKDDMYDKITNMFHPNPDALSPFARRLMNRNACQVLGRDLYTKTNCVVCWTPEGKMSGGTSQAMRIANYYKIPIYNMYKYRSALDVIEKILVQKN